MSPFTITMRLLASVLFNMLAVAALAYHIMFFDDVGTGIISAGALIFIACSLAPPRCVIDSLIEALRTAGHDT